ncbi:uncharacterized [Lates japonicus]
MPNSDNLSIVVRIIQLAQNVLHESAYITRLQQLIYDPGKIWKLVGKRQARCLFGDDVLGVQACVHLPL